MGKDIDERFMTDEFLLTYFPYKDRFHYPFDRGLSFSKELYVKYKTEINQKRAKSGKPPLSDSDLKQLIEEYHKILK